jgi:hypothetical protein
MKNNNQQAPAIFELTGDKTKSSNSILCAKSALKYLAVSMDANLTIETKKARASHRGEFDLSAGFRVDVFYLQLARIF